jgi:hypothetical protein
VCIRFRSPNSRLFIRRVCAFCNRGHLPFHHFYSISLNYALEVAFVSTVRVEIWNCLMLDIIIYTQNCWIGRDGILFFVGNCVLSFPHCIRTFWIFCYLWMVETKFEAQKAFWHSQVNGPLRISSHLYNYWLSDLRFFVSLFIAIQWSNARINPSTLGRACSPELMLP